MPRSANVESAVEGATICRQSPGRRAPPAPAKVLPVALRGAIVTVPRAVVVPPEILFKVNMVDAVAVVVTNVIEPVKLAGIVVEIVIGTFTKAEDAGLPAKTKAIGKLVIAVFTNAVVATCVLLVPAAAVGAVGVPVNAGEANAAREVSLG